MAARIPPPLPFALVGVIVGVIFGYLAVDLSAQGRALDDRGREATARVTEVRDRAWPRSPRATIEFDADGRAVRATITVERPTVGDELLVRYDPRDAAGNVVDATRGPGTPWLFFVLAALFLFGAPALAWFVIRPARRALAENPGLAARVERANRAAEQN